MLNDLFLKLMMDGDGAKWELSTFLETLTSSLRTWGSLIVILIGVVLIIVAIVKIAKGLMSGGRGGQTNWVLTIGMLLLGGVMAAGGAWAMFESMGEGAQATIDGMGKTSDMILPMIRTLLP